jgi:hypothetical protein
LRTTAQLWTEMRVLEHRLRKDPLQLLGVALELPGWRLFQKNMGGDYFREQHAQHGHLTPWFLDARLVRCEMHCALAAARASVDYSDTGRQLPNKLQIVVCIANRWLGPRSLENQDISRLSQVTLQLSLVFRACQGTLWAACMKACTMCEVAIFGFSDIRLHRRDRQRSFRREVMNYVTIAQIVHSEVHLHGGRSEQEHRRRVPPR